MENPTISNDETLPLDMAGSHFELNKELLVWKHVALSILEHYLMVTL